MKKLLAAVAIALVAFVIFFIWAPVVPYERLEFVEAPTSAVLCPGSQVCPVQPYPLWVRSYGSFGYDLLGYGTSPDSSPVTVEKNGVTTAFIFRGTNVTHMVGYPSSTPEPIPIMKINGVSFYPFGAPFGGSSVELSVTNMGVGETASVEWSISSPPSFASFVSQPVQIPAGGTMRINATSWVGPLPTQNSNITITVFATLYYPKMWLTSTDLQTVTVVYSK